MRLMLVSGSATLALDNLRTRMRLLAFRLGASAPRCPLVDLKQSCRASRIIPFCKRTPHEGTISPASGGLSHQNQHVRTGRVWSSRRRTQDDAGFLRDQLSHFSFAPYPYILRKSFNCTSVKDAVGRGPWSARGYLMQQFSIVWRIAITLIAFLVAIGIASTVFQIFLDHSYPAWTMIAALVIVSPLVFLLWRDRLSQ